MLINVTEEVTIIKLIKSLNIQYLEKDENS
jgi:hypothetical protein